MFEGVEAARAAIAALHFVSHPQDAIAIAERAQLLPVFGRRLDDAATALDRLKHDDADLRIGLEGFLNGRDIGEGNTDRVVNELEIGAVELTVGDGKHTLGLAVEGVFRIDDLRALRAGGALGKLDGGLHRL
ncbi:hypothetical protein D3C87_1534310 [compost metagenome]